jgi:hypothetical protein
MKHEFGVALCLFVAALFALRPTMSRGSEIWTGPPITFEKTAHAGTSDPSQQDRITDNVWITRDTSRGIFNAAAEDFYTNNLSPVDTEWAVGTTSDLGSLTFASWEDTIGLSSPIGGPPSSVGVDMVLHLITDDIYIDLEFLTWGVGPGAGGAFSYERSTLALGLTADFDNNDVVNEGDLTVWESSFGVDDLADADNDGDSDGADFAEWQRQFGDAAATPASAAIPEPSGAALILLGGSALLCALRRAHGSNPT